jgi:hypothetical protein
VGIEDDLSQPPQKSKAIMGKIAELLDRSGINPDEIGRVEKIRVWQGFHKDEDGNAQVVDLAGVVLSPEWAEGPQWPVVQQAAPTVIKPVAIKENKTNVRVTVILPDPQIGFRRMHEGELIACHDEAAMDVALQITRAARPDHIVNIGDFLDLPEWSTKFLVLPEFVLTTQPTIDAGHRYLAKQRAIAPNAEISLLEGNHDARMGKAIAQNAMAALRLRRADKPEEWPVLSVPYLLRLEELGVRYVGGYPAGRLQLTKGGKGVTALWAIHGEKLDVAKVAKAERQSFVQGHIHRVAYASQTCEVMSEPETVVAFSPGCLCRVDGVVPSTRGGTDDTGRPVLRWEDWQQGVAIITELPDGYWTTEIVPINKGQAIWRGKLFTATI